MYVCVINLSGLRRGGIKEGEYIHTVKCLFSCVLEAKEV